MPEQVLVKTQYRVLDTELLALLGLNPKEWQLDSVSDRIYNGRGAIIVTVVPAGAC